MNLYTEVKAATTSFPPLTPLLVNCTVRFTYNEGESLPKYLHSFQKVIFHTKKFLHMKGTTGENFRLLAQMEVW